MIEFLIFVQFIQLKFIKKEENGKANDVFNEVCS